MVQTELLDDQRRTLRRLMLTKAKLARRAPLLAKLQADQIVAKKEAIRAAAKRVEERFRKKNAKILDDYIKLRKELELDQKRYSELSQDIISTTNFEVDNNQEDTNKN